MSRIAAFVLLPLLAACASTSPEPEALPAPEPPTAEPIADAGAQEPQEPAPFQPPAPDEDGADWIQIVSGEWLRGEVTGLRDGTLDFDSDELDEQSFDWDDIRVLRSSRNQTILLVDGRTLSGTLMIRDGQVMLGGTQVQRIDRGEMMAIVPKADSELDYWSGKLSLGITTRQGNTNQTDMNASAFLRRETPSTRWDSGYNGAISRVEDTEVTNNHRATSRFNWYLTPRLFVTPIGIEWFRDTFQNIDYRLTPYAAVGYDLIDASSLSWEISVGPAYQYTKYDSAAAGENESDDTVAAIFTTGIDWDITSDVEFNFDYNITVPVPDSQNYNHRLSAMFSIDLVSDFDLDVQFIWDRVNNPVPDDQGEFPDEDDFRTVVGLGYTF